MKKSIYVFPGRGKKTKPVFRIDKITGKVAQEYTGAIVVIKEIMEQTGFKLYKIKTPLYTAIREQKEYGGWRWAYKEEWKENK